MLKRAEYFFKEDPDLYCAKCAEVYKDLPPPCMKPMGCKIEDLATDPDIAEFLNQFVLAKGIYDACGLVEEQRAIFKELGLLDDLQLLLELERLYATWKAIKREERARSVKRSETWQNVVQINR